MSQKNRVELMDALTGLTHDIFVGQVVNNVKRASATSSLFQDLGAGEYRLEGQNCVFAVDLRFKTGAMATDGSIPDFVPLDAVQGKVSPVRRYARVALDNLSERRASGPGSFDELSDRIFDHLWSAWESMEIRQSIGSSTGTVAKVSSRTSSTVVVLKDGLGNTGTNPLQNLSEGSILCWYDVSAAAIGGAAAITASGIAYANNTITLDSAATWEPTAATVAADDLIFFATTSDKSAAHFTAERNLAPNGVGTIVDPAGSATTVFNISQSTHARWKPFRKASSTFDHLELTEHWLGLGQKRGFKVTPSMDTVIAHPVAVAQLARSLMGFQQQAYTGGELSGGYSGLKVSGIEILEDDHFFHNVAATLCRDHLYRINLGGDADFWGEDGSMWSRIVDYDGKDAYVVDYMNYLCTHRGAQGALTGIVTPDVSADDFTSVPNH